MKKKREQSVSEDAVGALEYEKWRKHVDHRVEVLQSLDVYKFTNKEETIGIKSNPITIMCMNCNTIVTEIDDPNPVCFEREAKRDFKHKEVEVERGTRVSLQRKSKDGGTEQSIIVGA
jgi:hypothetical protein